MSTPAVIQTLLRFEVLNRLPRTGFLMRGIDPPESVGEHIFSTTVLGALVLEKLKDEGVPVDGEKLLKMIALHESGEVLTGDIPAPVTVILGKAKKSELELEASRKVLAGFPGLVSIVEEFEAGKSIEARIVKALDKLQMMIKVLLYESEGRGNMNDFWAYDGNFVKPGIPCLDGLVDSLRSLRGKLSMDILNTTIGTTPDGSSVLENRETDDAVSK